MKLNLLILFFAISTNYIYSQKAINLVVDPKIKMKSLRYISTTDSPTSYSIDSIYQTTFRTKLMVEDTISYNQLENSEYLKKDFKCNHY